MTRQPTPSEARVLACIAANPDRLTTGWDICADGQIKSDASVRVLVHRLRHSCGYQIESRPGIGGGYRLVQPWQDLNPQPCAFEWTAPHAPLTRPPTPSEAASALAKASHAKHRAHVLARAEELRRDTAAGLVAGRGR